MATWVVAVLWLSAVTAVMAAMMKHTNSPGPAGPTPLHWPADSRILPATARPTLVMFAHPRCPCTRASLEELDRLMARCAGKLSAQIWFIQPAKVPPDWLQTDLWSSAAAIPGVAVHADPGGEEARRFHAGTSGQSVLYDQRGHLLFQGGLTLSRGHAGDNPGVSAVVDFVEHSASENERTPVFGCSLFETACQTRDASCK